MPMMRDFERWKEQQRIYEESKIFTPQGEKAFDKLVRALYWFGGFWLVIYLIFK